MGIGDVEAAGQIKMSKGNLGSSEIVGEGIDQSHGGAASKPGGGGGGGGAAPKRGAAAAVPAPPAPSAVVLKGMSLIIKRLEDILPPQQPSGSALDVALMKVDVQGMECAVLGGARSMLDRIRIATAEVTLLDATCTPCMYYGRTHPCASSASPPPR